MSNDKLKNTAKFLMLIPAMSSRNLTSIILVAIFFGVYIAAGGKIAAIPKNLERGDGFGTVKEATQQTSSRAASKEQVEDSGFKRMGEPEPVRRDRQIDLFNSGERSPQRTQTTTAKKLDPVEDKASDVKDERINNASSSNFADFQERLNRISESRKK